MWPRRALADEPAPKPAPRTRRERRPRRTSAAPNHDRWLVSYADFITLLFAVFATMYALSAVDANKYAAMAASLQAAFGTVRPGAAPAAGAPIVLPVDARALVEAAAGGEADSEAGSEAGGEAGSEVGLDDVRARLEDRLAPVIDSNLVSLETDDRGLVVTLREAGAFPLSSADLSDVAKIILGEIGTALGDVGNHVRIEGHTDDVPISTSRFASNWELSTARATTVVRFLLDRTGLRPDRLSAAGYAEFFPRVPNTSDAARARNRRVDLVILTPQTRAAQEPAAHTAQEPAAQIAAKPAVPAARVAATPAGQAPAGSAGQPPGAQ